MDAQYHCDMLLLELQQLKEVLKFKHLNVTKPYMQAIERHVLALQKHFPCQSVGTVLASGSCHCHGIGSGDTHVEGCPHFQPL